MHVFLSFFFFFSPLCNHQPARWLWGRQSNNTWGKWDISAVLAPWSHRFKTPINYSESQKWRGWTEKPWRWPQAGGASGTGDRRHVSDWLGGERKGSHSSSFPPCYYRFVLARKGDSWVNVKKNNLLIPLIHSSCQSIPKTHRAASPGRSTSGITLSMAHSLTDIWSQPKWLKMTICWTITVCANLEDSNSAFFFAAASQ